LGIGPKVEKKILQKLGSQFATLGANVPTFINILMLIFLHFFSNLGLNHKQKNAQSWPQVFSVLIPM
jgi:hypothetical protein